LGDRRAAPRRTRLFLLQRGDAGEDFAFEEFEGGSAAGAAVGDFVGDAEFFGGGGGVASAHDRDGTSGGGLGDGSGHGFRAFGKFLEFKDAGGAVPDDGFGAGDGVGEDLAGLGSAIEAFESIGDARLVIGCAGGGVGGKFVGGDVVHREVDFHAAGFGFFHQLSNDLGAFGVEEAVADGHVLEDFFEGVGHAAADDDFVGGLDEVADERDFVGDFRAAENGEEGALRVVEHGGEGVEFLLHEEAGDLGKIDSDDGRVRAVGGAEGVADEDIAELREAGAEGFDIVRGGFGGGAVFVFGFAFLFDMEAEVFEKGDFAGLHVGAGGFDFEADAIFEETDGTAEEFGKLFGDGLEGVFGHAAAIRAAEVAHQDNAGSLVERVLDGREGGDDALGVRDGAGGFVLGNIEIDADEDAFSIERDVGDRFFHASFCCGGGFNSKCEMGDAKWGNGSLA